LDGAVYPLRDRVCPRIAKVFGISYAGLTGWLIDDGVSFETVRSSRQKWTVVKE